MDTREVICDGGKQIHLARPMTDFGIISGAQPSSVPTRDLSHLVFSLYFRILSMEWLME
jgi:hypothetical protein